MQKYIINIIISLIFIIFLAQASTALVIKSVDAQDIFPGQESTIRIEVDNTLEDDLEDVSLSLNLQDLPLSTIGSSEKVIDKLNENEDDFFTFKIRAFPTAEPQDYKIPYTLAYKGIDKPRTGTISFRVIGNVELFSIISSEKPVLGYQDELTLKIINKGFADARYVSVKILPTGITLYSDDIIYIGDISSNDFETATFNVRYNSPNVKIEALIEYLDFNNQKQNLVLKDNLKIYTQEEAIKEGIISRDNTIFYVFIFLAIVVIFIIWRGIRKRMRKKRSIQRGNSA